MSQKGKLGLYSALSCPSAMDDIARRPLPMLFLLLDVSVSRTEKNKIFFINYLL
jgi:glutathionyl-hydroquinone reductase